MWGWGSDAKARTEGNRHGNWHANWQGNSHVNYGNRGNYDPQPTTHPLQPPRKRGSMVGYSPQKELSTMKRTRKSAEADGQVTYVTK